MNRDRDRQAMRIFEKAIELSENDRGRFLAAEFELSSLRLAFTRFKLLLHLSASPVNSVIVQSTSHNCSGPPSWIRLNPGHVEKSPESVIGMTTAKALCVHVS